jgi:hypothetical protein
MVVEIMEHEQLDAGDYALGALFRLVFDLCNVPLTVALIQRYACTRLLSIRATAV